MKQDPKTLRHFLRWRFRRIVSLLSRLLPPCSTEVVEHSICIINGGLGDRLMALPALRLLKNRHRHASLTVVWMDGDLSVADHEFTRTISMGRARLVSVIAELMRKKWSLAYTNCQASFSVSSELLILVSRARLRIGPDMPWTRHLYTHRYCFDLQTHVTVVNSRGIDPQLPAAPLSYRIARPHTAANSIAIHPGSRKGYEFKRWPIQWFQQVVSQLRTDHSVVIILGPDEREGFGGLESLVVRPRACAELVSVLSGCSLLLANDSGPAHLAAALDIAVIVLFGPTNPIRVAPVFSRGALLTPTIECAPCFDRTGSCRHGACLRSIRPETVVQQARLLLKEVNPDPEKRGPFR